MNADEKKKSFIKVVIFVKDGILCRIKKNVINNLDAGLVLCVVSRVAYKWD